MLAYLRAGELEKLANQLQSADLDPGSLLGVSAFQLGRQSETSHPEDGRLSLGDSYAMIPPFTGNGMTMAFQSAEIALQPLLNYAADGSTWQETVDTIRSDLTNQVRPPAPLVDETPPFHAQAARTKIARRPGESHAIPFGLLFAKTR